MEPFEYLLNKSEAFERLIRLSIMKKNQWALIAFGVTALFSAVSCTPVGGPFPSPNSGPFGSSGGSAVNAATSNGQTGSASLPGSTGSGGPVTAGDLRQLREQRAQVGSGEQLINSGRNWNPETGVGANSAAETVNQNDLPPLPFITPQYRYAVPVPGRKGWVYNPYTNRPIDVRGVEPGRLIYDERDPENRNADGTLKPVPDMPNKFRVP